jgi:formylglycine-generating enzyme required for sulfatase activity
MRRIALFSTCWCVETHRGGSWKYNPEFLRSAQRNWINTELRYNDLGFRVGRTLTP